MAFAYAYTNLGGTGDRTTVSTNVDPRITVTSTLTISGGGAFSNLCDGAFGNTTADSFKVTSVAASGKEIKFDLTKLGARVITEFKFYQETSDTHGVWDFKGSMDDSSYTTLQASITLGGATTQTQAVANTTKYLYYKFVGVSGNTNATPFWQEMEFKISGNALIEAGDRTATATVTFSGTVPFGTASNWIDGAYANSSADSASFQAVTAVGKILKIDFGSGNAARVTGFTWWQQTADSHGTFDFEGSNDNSSWTPLKTGFTLGGATRTRYDVTNATQYRYYRLSGTAGTLSATPWLWEWEFEEEALASSTYNESVTETGTPTDTVTALIVALAALTETATATDTVTASGSFGSSVTETATATDTVSTTSVSAASVTETATPTDTVSAATAAAAALTESATATDTVDASTILVPRTMVIIICG